MVHYIYSDEMYHHGILGMKWGIRRYQNPDGTLTPEGRARYLTSDGKHLCDDGKKLITKQIGKVRARNEFKKIDVERRKGHKLAENPVIKELAKDYIAKHKKYAEAWDEHQKEVKEFYKNSDTQKHFAKLMAEREADDEIYDDAGKKYTRWEYEGFKSRKDCVDFYEQQHSAESASVFAHYYAPMFSMTDKIAMIAWHADDLYFLQQDAKEAFDKFQNELMNQIKDDVLPSHASEDDIKQILYYAADRVHKLNKTN